MGIALTKEFESYRLKLTVRLTDCELYYFSTSGTAPKRKKLRAMLDEDDLADPGSPVKDLETKLSPYKTQLLTDVKGN